MMRPESGQRKGDFPCRLGVGVGKCLAFTMVSQLLSCCLCCFRYTGACECEWTVDPAFEPMRSSSIIYFVSAAVAVDSSHMTASLSTSWIRFSPPNFVSGHVLTTWFMVCRWSQLVLDRVRHFWPIPIHRFFAVNRIRYRFFDTLQERSWCRVTDRSKTADSAAATNNSGAPWTRCSAAADAFDLSWTVKHSNYQ